VIAGLWGLTLGAAIFSAINERELRRRRVDLQALVTLSASLDRAGGPEAMAQVLAQQGADNFNATRSAVLSARGEDYELLATYGDTGETPGQLAIGSAVREAWDTAGAVLLKRADPEADPDLATVFPNGHFLVVLPMLAEGLPVGALVLELGHSVGGRVERRLVDTAGQFAAQAALAIENARLLREVGRLAATDALTGLANRRTLATDLDRALSRARRTGRPVSMVLVDVDHFKNVNDRFGHRTGDELLRSVANVLASCAGGSATAARYGGEEFALLLPDMTAEAGRRTAEAVRRAVPRGTDPAVTVSAGVATVMPSEGPVADLVAEADRALYAAKRGGRDRVVHVQELPEDLWVELAAPV
jgi:diguanylate cyclase (GGDEF)-like protein